MTNLREAMARALYEHRERPVVNADFSRQQALWHDCLLQADVALAAIEAAGWQMVPLSAVRSMDEAVMIWGSIEGAPQFSDADCDLLAAWAALKAAAPKP